MSVADNLRQVLADLPEGVQLVAVSKFHPNEAILEAYGAGQRIFGESKVQEMCLKHEALPKDIRWHFIGHLQTNKVKYIAPYVALIHGIDSFRLLAEVDKQGAKAGRTIDVLLQIHIAREETKFGFTPDECRELLAGDAWKSLSTTIPWPSGRAARWSGWVPKSSESGIMAGKAEGTAKLPSGVLYGGSVSIIGK